MAHDVFLSYSYQDKAAADGICHSLEAQGVRCWIAPRDVVPGADWQQSIMDSITSSKAVILIFTAHTNQSENVRKEISAAVDAGAVVIPFFIEDVKPEGSLKFQLIGVHWLDAYAPPMEEHIERLASTIFSLSGHAPPEHHPTPEPPPPIPPITPPPNTVIEPPKPAPTAGVMAMWAGLSNDRKITVAAVAALVVVSLIAIASHMPKTPANAAASAAAASTAVAAASSSSAASASAAAPDSSTSDSSAVAAADERAAGTLDRHVQVINQTEHAMIHFYASNVDETSWQEDILGTSVLAPGESSRINIDDGTGHCLFDFKAVFDDNTSLVRHSVDVCKIAVYRYTGD